MKKIIIGLVVTTALIFSASSSNASGFLGIASKLYFLQSWGESINLFFNFSKDAKLDYLLKLTDKRVNEISNNPSSTSINRYNDHFDQITQLAGEVPDKNQATEKIKEASLRQQETLARVYSQVPQQAQQAILRAQVESSKNVAQVIENTGDSKEAQDYTTKTENIQKVEQAGRVEQAPMEGSPNGDPSQSVPRELKGLNEINQENGFNSLNPIKSGQGSQAGSQKMAPVQPIQMNAPVIQN